MIEPIGSLCVEGGCAMTSTSREAQLGEVFVSLADTLVADYDIVDLLHTLVTESVKVLDVDEAGLVLADENDSLQVMASTSERSNLIEALQLESHEGPCIQAYLSGEVVTIDDIGTLVGRWDRFKALSTLQGFKSVHAVPLRLRNRRLGALNLFRERTGPLNYDDATMAQALADVATIGIVQERIAHEQRGVRDQLQRALDERVVIEQAKGVIAQSHNIPVDVAFARLRDYARINNGRLLEVARSVVGRNLSV
jgi:GAF domain-containing protein